MTTSTLPGSTEQWRVARRLRKQLTAMREKELAVSRQLDEVIGDLATAGNSGYVIAKELGMERPTVARILRRAELNGS